MKPVETPTTAEAPTRTVPTARMNRVLRWAIPVDGRDHVVVARGAVVHTVVRGSDAVEFWTYPEPLEPDSVAPRVFRVFGTGEPIPAGYSYWATAPRSIAGFVWHLFERTA